MTYEVVFAIGIPDNTWNEFIYYVYAEDQETAIAKANVEMSEMLQNENISFYTLLGCFEEENV